MGWEVRTDQHVGLDRVIEIPELLGRNVVETGRHPTARHRGLHAGGHRTPGRNQRLELLADAGEGVGHADHDLAVEGVGDRGGGAVGGVPRRGDDNHVGRRGRGIVSGGHRQVQRWPLLVQLVDHLHGPILGPRADDHVEPHRCQAHAQSAARGSGTSKDADLHGATLGPTSTVTSGSRAESAPRYRALMPDAVVPPEPAVELRGVSLVRDGQRILRDIDWTVEPGQRWVVLGPNGAGKTTLLRIASLWEHPTTGSVTVLGERLGHTDVRQLRTRIGVASPALADQFRPNLSVADVVMTGRRGALEPWWHTYDEIDRARTADALDAVGASALARQRFGTLSSGERQRVQLARTLATDPDLLILDEPTAGLDLGAREELVGRLGRLAADPQTPPVILVTHHVEEIPPGFTHAMLMRDGSTVTSGPLPTTITAKSLSKTFGITVELAVTDNRYRAWSTPDQPADAD
jgi:iron complex transport system ATP-binding protein